MNRTFNSRLYGLFLTASFAAVPMAGAGSTSVYPVSRGSGLDRNDYSGYEGTIACASAAPSREASARCAGSAREWRLVLQDGAAVPLLVVNPELRERLASEPLQGRRVLVLGRYYRTNNTIVVADVTAQP